MQGLGKFVGYWCETVSAISGYKVADKDGMLDIWHFPLEVERVMQFEILLVNCRKNHLLHGRNPFGKFLWGILGHSDSMETMRATHSLACEMFLPISVWFLGSCADIIKKGFSPPTP